MPTSEVYLRKEVGMASKYRVSINLTESEYRELAAVAEKSRVSMAWLGREAVIQLLDRSKTEEPKAPFWYKRT